MIRAVIVPSFLFYGGIDMYETIIHTKDIFDGRIVHLKIHEVRLPDGEIGTREVIHHVGAVAIIATDAKHNVLLIKQFRLPMGKVIFEIPAGTLEVSETPQSAAERELQEEAGYKPLSMTHLGGIHPAPAYTTEFIHLYWTRDFIESKLAGDIDEFVEPVWIPIASVIEMIAHGEITDSKTVVAVLRVARELGL